MKTIALFGASGRTGIPLAEMLLDAGYQIKALVRTPAKLTVQHKNLIVIKGDALNAGDIEKTVAGADAIISVIGQGSNTPAMMQTHATQHMVNVAKKHGISRIISMTGGGVPYKKDKPGVPDKIFGFVMNTFFKKVITDAKAHAEVLRKSGLDWTIVRGPRLTNGPLTKKYRVGWVGVNSSTSASRKDVAHFIIHELETSEYVHEMPFVSN